MAAGGAGAGGPLWHVTGQQETTRTTPTGGFATGVTVLFTTASGVSGSVFVADAQYNVDRVRELVSARVDQLEAVQGLSG